MPRKWQHSDPDGSVINWPPGSVSVIQDYGSADPDPKEIFRVRIHNIDLNKRFVFKARNLSPQLKWRLKRMKIV